MAKQSLQVAPPLCVEDLSFSGLRMYWARLRLAEELHLLQLMMEMLNPQEALAWEGLLEDHPYPAMQLLASGALGLNAKEAVLFRPASHPRRMIRTEFQKQAIRVLRQFVVAMRGKRSANLCDPALRAEDNLETFLILSGQRSVRPFADSRLAA